MLTNQEKALVGAFSVIVKSLRNFVYPSFQALTSTLQVKLELRPELPVHGDGGHHHRCVTLHRGKMRQLLKNFIQTSICQLILSGPLQTTHGVMEDIY